MKKIISILILVVLLPNMADAQRWKRFRRQFTFGVGVTNFLGELGGADQIGTDGLRDLEFSMTRPALMVGYRYQVNSYFFLRSHLTWGILRGSDDLTNEPARRARNLSFRSGILELSVAGEFYFIQNARGSIYRLRGVRGRRSLKMDIYVWGGFSAIYFNPKAEINGVWHSLQPLGTEGQGLDGEPDKYNRITYALPYGIGIGKSIDRYWSFNIEFGMRKTFTDYLDDVSTDYYDNDILRAERGDLAADLADRNLLFETNVTDKPVDSFQAGQQRGDESDNDAFMIGMFTLSRKIVKRRRSRPKF